MNVKSYRIRKKRKIAQTPYSRSSLFTNKFDQVQYQKLFRNINTSGLIQRLGVSEGLVKEIAEYSNGQWVKCCHERPQFQNLVSNVQDSTLVKNQRIPQFVVQEISEYTTKDKICNSQISILRQDVHKRLPLKCGVCKQESYYQWCCIHNQPFTVPGPYHPMCDGCFNTMCYQVMQRCSECNSLMCDNCIESWCQCVGCGVEFSIDL